MVHGTRTVELRRLTNFLFLIRSIKGFEDGRHLHDVGLLLLVLLVIGISVDLLLWPIPKLSGHGIISVAFGHDSHDLLIVVKNT